MIIRKPSNYILERSCSAIKRYTDTYNDIDVLPVGTLTHLTCGSANCHVVVEVVKEFSIEKEFKEFCELEKPLQIYAFPSFLFKKGLVKNIEHVEVFFTEDKVLEKRTA